MPALTICITAAWLALSPAKTDSTNHPPWPAMFRPDRYDILIPDIEDTFSAAFRDINGDGYPDLYLVCYRSLNRLLINQGDDLGFRDETVASGLGGNLMPMAEYNVELNAAVLDVDNDGDGDVIIAGRGLTTRLFYNENNLRFTPADDTALNEIRHLKTSQIIGADVNLDGHIDLFFADEELTNRLLLNNGRGQFFDATRQSGLESYARSFGAAFGDLNNDGAPDLYVANAGSPDELYQNRGDGRFMRRYVDIPTLTDSLSSTAVTLGDVDNDGDLDFFVAGPADGPGFLCRNTITKSDTVWHFTSTPLGQGTDSWDGMMADLDHNGWIDLFVSHQGPNRLYANHGGQFSQVWIDSLSPDAAAYSMGATAGDYDRDGDLDLFVANRDTFSVFYPNPLNNLAWLEVQVEGVQCNRDGLGARVSLYRPTGQFASGDRLFIREIGTGGGYLSRTRSSAHFGLGTQRSVDIAVRFPSGRTVHRLHVTRGQRVMIREYSGLSRTLILLSRGAARLLTQFQFWGTLLLIAFFLTATFYLISLGLKRYHWSPLTATITMAFFFFMAYGLILSLSGQGLIRVFILIDALSLLVGSALILHFERMLKLRRQRDRDRAVLVELTHQIVEIRDEAQLMETVVEHLTLHSDFQRVAIHLKDQPGVKAHLVERGFPDLKTWQHWPLLFNSLGQSHWASVPSRGPETAKWMLAIGRGTNRFGLMLLGGRTLSGSPTAQDRQLFASIASQMAIALENIAYIQQSNEMIQKLTEAEVREQYLAELETSNRSLDEKNRELRRLYDELKQAEAQLIQTEKMASLGQLVAGIAHELNNPIGFIYANIRQLKTYLQPIQQAAASAVDEATDLHDILPDLEGLIEDTVRGSQAVKAVVENLRTFSHLDQAEMTDTDVHEGLETSLMIARPQLKNRIEVICDFQADAKIEAYPGQLNQVFLNLIVNATQVMEDHGRITLSTRNREGGLEVTVADNGPGIPESVQAKIFDPFFSTKDIGQGMGLGLSISYAIIEKHGGHIHLESTLGQGTTFTLWLPRKQASPTVK